MKRKQTFISLLIVLSIAALTYVAAVTAAGNRPSANGQGSLRINDELRTFSFHASTDKDGNVTGSAEVHNRELDIRSHIEINCLEVSGNIATMSGVVTNSSDPNVEGSPSVFRVRDNGEGAKAAPDQISLVSFNPNPNAPPIDCHASFNFALQNIEGGNIQVKP